MDEENAGQGVTGQLETDPGHRPRAPDSQLRSPGDIFSRVRVYIIYC